MLTQKLQYEKTTMQPSRIGLWIWNHTKKDGNPIDLASSEAIVCLCYINSTIILVSQIVTL